VEAKWPLLCGMVFLLPISLLIMTRGSAGAEDRVL
jgi:hypothetical protein